MYFLIILMCLTLSEKASFAQFSIYLKKQKKPRCKRKHHGLATFFSQLLKDLIGSVLKDGIDVERLARHAAFPFSISRQDDL